MPNLPVPATQPPESYGWKLFDIVMRAYDAAKMFAEKENKAVRLECTTDFGPLHVTHLSVTSTPDLFLVEGRDEDDVRCAVLMDASRCSFKFSQYDPSKGEKAIVGFGAKGAAVKPLQE